MRSSKRVLAGVAAGALGLALVPFVAPSATAATVTGTASPVRVTFTGSALDAVPYASLNWTTSGALLATDTVAVTLTTAPSPLAELNIGTPATIGTAVTNTSGSITSGAANATLSAPTQSVALTGGAASTGATASIAIAANQAGTYAGTFVSYNAGVALDSGTFSLTTVGKAASMTLTPASQSVSVNGTATLLAALKDGSGNATQPLVVDSIATSVSPTGSGSPSAITTTGAGAGSLFDGEAAFTLAPTAAGTYTVTATPGGTLPAGGVTAQSATVTASGTVSTLLLSNITVDSPVTANDAGTQPSTTADIPANTSSVTVTVTGNASAVAGDVIRLKGTASAGTPSSSSPEYQNVTLNASKQASATFTLGGDALLNGATFTIVQVNAANSTVAGPAQVVLSQATRVTATSTITVSPSGANVRALGTTTAVTVNVKDQFGDPMSGFAVRSYRNATAGTNFLNLGTTDSSGNAVVNVEGASGITTGTTEQYSFRVTSPAGTNYDKDNALQIEYTTSGDVTGLSVAVSTAGATTPVTNTTTSIAVLPYAVVPYDGTVNAPATGTYTVSSGAGTAAGEYVTFTPTATPANSVTVTVPTGVKVATSLTNLIWSGGSQSAVVATGSPVYVFATKTGTHDVTFTSGSITSTAKIQVATAPAASYNMAITPATQTVQAGSFNTVTVTVTDVFGNPVPGATGTGTGGVTLSVTGEALFGGLSNTTNVTTGADGTAAVSVVAGNAGTATITGGPQGGSSTTTPAWVSGYTPPTGAPAPVASAAAEITVTSSSTKSITITGERGTVKGKPGIMVDGITVGFAEGDVVVPYVKFPGQTEYSEGTARPTIDADGEFYWQRKTGKKIYIYFKNEDGSVKSDRIIIQAK